VSFALASLSCTIAPFLAVTAASLAAGGPVGVVTALIAYALGMGTIVLTLALAVAAARTSAIRGMRRAGAMISRASGALLVAAGAYVAWYGWFEIRVLAGSATADPIVSAAVRVQATLSRWVASLGPAGLLAVGAATVSAAVVLVFATRARARRRAEPVR
jgi:cytochrome c-type biogenesis protein